MSGIAFHFASGDAFFTGAALIAAVCVAAILRRKRAARRWEQLVCLMGCILIAFSATPFSLWFYIGWGGFAVLWWVARCRGSDLRTLRQISATAMLSTLMLFITILSIGYELSYRFSIAPRLKAGVHSSVAIIGDSISAGMLGPKEQTWPKQFKEQYHVQVLDVSAAGATVRSAIKQAEKIPDDTSLVVVEIGGNDVLGPTTANAFEDDLDKLLQKLYRPGHQLVMLELPLPPFYNAFGRTQRTLANRYDVALISKRDFASVLASNGTTLDGLHLSDKGHRLMADMIWKHIGTALQIQRAEK